MTDKERKDFFHKTARDIKVRNYTQFLFDAYGKLKNEEDCPSPKDYINSINFKTTDFDAEEIITIYMAFLTRFSNRQFFSITEHGFQVFSYHTLGYQTISK